MRKKVSVCSGQTTFFDNRNSSVPSREKQHVAKQPSKQISELPIKEKTHTIATKLPSTKINSQLTAHPNRGMSAAEKYLVDVPGYSVRDVGGNPVGFKKLSESAMVAIYGIEKPSQGISVSSWNRDGTIGAVRVKPKSNRKTALLNLLSEVEEKANIRIKTNRAIDN